MLYVPRHSPNGLEYKVLSCISVHYQSRMTSNGIAITPSHPPTVQAGQYGESFYTSRSYPGTVLGDVVGAAAWGSRIYTLRGGLDGCEQMCTLHAVFVLGVCLRETWTVVETFLNTS